jgi:hypothetical protein
VVVFARGCVPIHSIHFSHISIANHINNNNNCTAYGNAHIFGKKLYTLDNESWGARAIPKSLYNFEFPNFELELEPNRSGTASGDAFLTTTYHSGIWGYMLYILVIVTSHKKKKHPMPPLVSANLSGVIFCRWSATSTCFMLLEYS